MILDPNARALSFNAAKQISPFLGGVFQNEMELTPEHFDHELADIDALKLKIETYRSQVLMLRKRAL